MNSNYRIAATLCSLETWFVSGILMKIPCMKEINNNNNNNYYYYNNNNNNNNNNARYTQGCTRSPLQLLTTYITHKCLLQLLSKTYSLSTSAPSAILSFTSPNHKLHISFPDCFSCAILTHSANFLYATSYWLRAARSGDRISVEA